MAVTLGASVTPLVKYRLPVVERSEPIVTPLSVPLELCSTVPPVLVSVPFLMVPLKLPSPPTPNNPADPMSRLPPPKSSVPTRLMTADPERCNPIKSPVPNPPCKLRVPPLTPMLPTVLLALLQILLLAPTLSVPALTTNCPVLPFWNVPQPLDPPCSM